MKIIETKFKGLVILEVSRGCELLIQKVRGGIEISSQNTDWDKLTAKQIYVNTLKITTGFDYSELEQKPKKKKRK